MYAIIRTGGKQAKVRSGDVLVVARLKADSESISFTPLLVVDDEGSTISDRAALSGITVTAKVLGETKGQKIDIFKYKNKSGYSRRMGHRQTYTKIEVTGIELPNKRKAPKKAAPKAKAEAATEEE